MLRYQIIAALMGGVFCLLAELSLAADTVTDLAGRTVEVPESVERVILGESRYIPALAILEGEQLPDRLAGLLPDFEMTDPGGYAQYLKAFPSLADIPRVGHTSADSFSLESVLAMEADLAIFSLEGHGPGAHNRALIDSLQRAGVAVVFVDFRQDPLVNTPRSMAVLGEILGRQDEAEVFNRFYSERPEGEAFGEHSGLGLSIAQQIAQGYGGDLVASNCDGACFTLTLPRTEI